MLSVRLPRNVQSIYCGNHEANEGRGHFVARVNAGKLELWCAKCKTFHVVEVADVVAMSVADLRNGHEPEGERRLLW